MTKWARRAQDDIVTRSTAERAEPPRIGIRGGRSSKSRRFFQQFLLACYPRNSETVPRANTPTLSSRGAQRRGICPENSEGHESRSFASFRACAEQEETSRK